MQQFYDLEHPPLLVVISGSSGVGKDSIAKAVTQQMRERGSPVHFVVTATTRPRRESEVQGRDYLFVSREAFEDMIAKDELLEYASVYDQYKGVPRQQVREAMDSGKDVVMRLDVQGAATIRRLAPDAVLIFLTTSSEEELIDRLKRRHTESDDQLRLRVQTAREEMRRIPEFDYVIPNLDQELDRTVETVLAVITAEKHRTHPRRAKL